MILNKSLLELKPPFIIVHVVNDKNVMGAGVAKQLYERWPQVKRDYHNFFEGPPKTSILGRVILTPVMENGYVASLIAQEGYGEDRRHLQYDALSEAMEEIRRMSNGLDIPVYAPYKIGCGLAGGNWEIVQPLMEKIIEVNFCKIGN